MRTVIDRYRMLLAETSTDYVRDIHDSIDWSDSLIAIMGAGRVGKTTLVLSVCCFRDSLYLRVIMGDLIRSIFEVFRLAGPFNTILLLFGIFLIVYCSVYSIKDDFKLKSKESDKKSPDTFIFEIEDHSKTE